MSLVSIYSTGFYFTHLVSTLLIWFLLPMVGFVCTPTRVNVCPLTFIDLFLVGKSVPLPPPTFGLSSDPKTEIRHRGDRNWFCLFIAPWSVVVPKTSFGQSLLQLVLSVICPFLRFLRLDPLLRLFSVPKLPTQDLSKMKQNTTFC